VNSNYTLLYLTEIVTVSVCGDLQLSWVPVAESPFHSSNAVLLFAPKFRLEAEEQLPPAPVVALMAAEDTPAQPVKAILNASSRVLLARSV
jgi:hypothetical protein